MTDMPSTHSVTDILDTPAFDEAYLELTRYAYTRARNAAEADEVVSDTVLAWMQDLRAGKRIENTAGYLRTVFERRLCDYLRRKYRREVELSDDGTILETIPDDADPEERQQILLEEEAVRKALGRLAAIYREVVYRHYVKGQRVETIAKALGVPVGTVKSRLSDGRGQMKETVTRHLQGETTSPSVRAAGEAMQKEQKNFTADTRPYSEVSYAPKRVTIGIWGNVSQKGEPFCYVESLIAQNILVLAYEKPISIRDLSAALGIPTPYVEHEVDILVRGEMMGRTPGGLVYTRIFMQTEEEGLGDVEAQEALAAEIAPALWRVMEEGLAHLWEDETSATCTYSPKQTATFRLMLANQMIGNLLFSPEMEMREPDVTPPPRPNGGWWLATGTVYEYGTELNAHKYSCSGPVRINYVKPPEREGELPMQMAMMMDYQSLFGTTHWNYRRMKYSFGLNEILKLYASFMTDTVKPADHRIFELIPEFEKMRILRRDEGDEIRLDIPAMTLAEWDRWEAALRSLVPAAMEAVGGPIKALIGRTVNRVPDHVDGRTAYLRAGSTGCLIPATMKALAENGCIPDVVMGETPVILVVYNDGQERWVCP
ncbi:MAG: RNA polymerase sigma factor [Clostridia bacterium]|nr:RNA polymerase sigma factor [Clostridia bacterium]